MTPSSPQPPADVIRAPVRPHNPHCAACGSENPQALGLERWREGEEAVGEATLDARHAGAPGLAHGGVLALLLDDMLGTASSLRVPLSVTGTLEVRYRKPVVLPARLRVRGHVVAVEGRKVRVAGTIHDHAGDVVAEADGVWIEVPREHFRAGYEASS